MRQYLDLLQDIKDNGEWEDPAREGMPRTKSIFSRELRFDLTKGFPAVTTKKLYWKGVVGELLWFLRGDTNIKYLVDNNIHIWDDDAYKYYKRKFIEKYPKSSQNCFTKEEFISIIEARDIKKLVGIQGLNYTLGDCGNIYGYQWRGWERKSRDFGFDQIKNLIESIRKNPNSRYHIVTAWQPTDFLRDEEAALPACHMLFQVYIRQGKYLDLKMVQRSCDTFLGVPFNIASYALLTHILAAMTGYQAGEFIWSGNNIHYYENQQEQVDELLTREPKELSELLFKDTFHYKIEMLRKEELSLGDFLINMEIDEFKLENYNSHPALKAPLSVGV